MYNIFKRVEEMNKPITIAIVGNIGSGKSTLLERIVERNNEFVIGVEEPIEEWKQCGSFAEYYKDMNAKALNMQIMIISSRLAHLKKSSSSVANKKFIICDGCIQTDREMFAKNLLNNGSIRAEGYELYERLFDYHVKMVPECEPDVYLYLDADVDMCTKRIQIRGRPEEQTRVTREYLAGLHELLTAFIKKECHEKKVFRLDASKTLDELADEVDRNLESLVLVN
jgi:deoxyadenosine/deoxycytidine kinase